MIRSIIWTWLIHSGRPSASWGLSKVQGGCWGSRIPGISLDFRQSSWWMMQSWIDRRHSCRWFHFSLSEPKSVWIQSNHNMGSGMHSFPLKFDIQCSYPELKDKKVYYRILGVGNGGFSLALLLHANATLHNLLLSCFICCRLQSFFDFSPGKVKFMIQGLMHSPCCFCPSLMCRLTAFWTQSMYSVRLKLG